MLLGSKKGVGVWFSGEEKMYLVLVGSFQDVKMNLLLRNIFFFLDL